MGRKRTAKVVVKKKVPARLAKVTKAAAAATPPAKKRGRPSTKQPEKSKNLSIADIVKDKNVSTCEECGGVWFSDVLFQKHLTICKKPNSSVASSSKEAITNEVIAIKTKVPDLSITFEKKKNADTSGKTNINAVAKAGLQSIMSNKVQSLLASRSQDIAEDVDSDSSVEETNIRSAVSISASNLRKNIASSLMKSNAENSGRPTRNSGLPTSSPSKASSASSQADLLAKKTLESSTTAGNKVVASVEVHSSANQRGKENGSPTKLGAPRLKDLPRNIRGRKNDAAFDALTTLSSAVEEQIVDDPLEVQTRNKIRRTPNKPAREIITLDDATNNGDAISAEADKASKNRTSPRGRRALANKSVPEIVASTSKAVENAPTPKKRGRKPKNKEVEEIDPVKDKQKSATSIIYDVESSGIIIPGEPEILNPLEAVKEEEDESEQKFDSQESGSNDDPNAVTFTCAVCQKSFTRKYQLDRHLKISKCSGLPLPSFPCELCNRVYTRKDNLREHLRSHTGEVHRRKNHKCPYCDKAFHGQSLLAIHIRKHTGEKPFACDFCPKRFPSTGALTKHRMTHTGEKPYSCNECGRKFTLKGTLSRHLRTHTGIRPHTCTFCGKKFIQIGGLNAHMFYHTGENGFKCEDCGKVFNRKARLQMHQLYVHIKLKPFTCEHCSKQFTRKEDLMRHAVLHTGEKPYKCPTCDRGFSVKPSLKIHLLTHTKEEPRSCHECGRAFIRKDCLLRHMRKRHRDVFDKLLFDEKDKKDVVNTRVLSEKDLTENIRELLYLLIDEPTLVGFGWPDKAVDEVLELVIQRCGHTPVSRDQYNYMDRLRENAKLLFTVVIDDNAVKTLLNNQTVDEVILHVLRLAKT